jgi:hypothetical protein
MRRPARGRISPRWRRRFRWTLRGPLRRRASGTRSGFTDGCGTTSRPSARGSCWRPRSRGVRTQRNAYLAARGAVLGAVRGPARPVHGGGGSRSGAALRRRRVAALGADGGAACGARSARSSSRRDRAGRGRGGGARAGARGACPASDREPGARARGAPPVHAPLPAARDHLCQPAPMRWVIKIHCVIAELPACSAIPRANRSSTARRAGGKTPTAVAPTAGTGRCGSGRLTATRSANRTVVHWAGTETSAVWNGKMVARSLRVSAPRPTFSTAPVSLSRA